MDSPGRENDSPVSERINSVQRLPDDVLRLIVLEVLKDQDSFSASAYPPDGIRGAHECSLHLATLALVSRRLQEMAFPLLYRNIRLMTLAQSRLFARTIADRPDLGLFVLSLVYSDRRELESNYTEQTVSIDGLPNLRQLFSVCDITFDPLLVKDLPDLESLALPLYGRPIPLFSLPLGSLRSLHVMHARQHFPLDAWAGTLFQGYLPSLRPFLPRVGPQLDTLQLTEHTHVRHVAHLRQRGQHPSWIVHACPKLKTLWISIGDPTVAAPFLETTGDWIRHLLRDAPPSLTRLVVGSPWSADLSQLRHDGGKAITAPAGGGEEDDARTAPTTSDVKAWASSLIANFGRPADWAEHAPCLRDIVFWNWVRGWPGSREDEDFVKMFNLSAVTLNVLDRVGERAG